MLIDGSDHAVDALERTTSAIGTGSATGAGEVYSFGRESEQFPTRFRTMPIGETNAAKAGTSAVTKQFRGRSSFGL